MNKELFFYTIFFTDVYVLSSRTDNILQIKIYKMFFLMWY